MAKRLQRSAPSASSRAEKSAGPTASTGAVPQKGGRVPRDLVTDFTVQLATLSEAGIPIVKALTILEGQTRAGPFKLVLAELGEDVAAGTPLSESMSKHRCFDRLRNGRLEIAKRRDHAGRLLRR